MKKLLSIILALVLCFGALSASAATVWDAKGNAYWVNDWEVDSYRYAGYFSSDDIYYNMIQPQYNQYKSSKDYCNLLNLVTNMLPFTYGSAHEQSMYVIRTEAMYLWYLSCGRPVGISDVSVSNGNTVTYNIGNLAYKDISYIEIKFNYGGREYIITDDVYLTPGSTSPRTCTFYSGNNFYSANNIRVTYIKFANGTSWGTRS
ncbi:MAG: hypothetical protein IKJ68_06300 [Clostridia bacterium]|nr:hypothetical protein [Clostridia bacterium]